MDSTSFVNLGSSRLADSRRRDDETVGDSDSLLLKMADSVCLSICLDLGEYKLSGPMSQSNRVNPSWSLLST